MRDRIYGGIDIAMKMPAFQYEDTIAFYRYVIGLEEITDKPPAVGFALGPNKLWIDRSPAMGQAEVWLEFLIDDFERAAARMLEAEVVRCDAIEPLPDGFRGGWITSPANIVHMLRVPDAW